MRRITILIILLLSCMGVLFAQAPEKFTYQAVVRNSNNQLVVNTQVGVQVVILRGSAQGSIVYGERHTQGTNANGLITLNIGEGNIIAGQFSNIDWSSGVFFISVGIDPVGGTDYTIWSTQQLLSVPYALYAKEAGNGFSGNYNDLTNLPQIPQIPINVSVFNNDAGYITMDSIPPIPTIPSNVSAFANDVGYITMDSVPPIPTIPTNVSAFNNDAGYLQSYTETDPQYNAWNKDYNDLINKPAIPTVPTNVGAFANDAGYITMDSVPQIPTNVSAFTNDAGYLQSFTETQNLANVTALGNSAGNRQLKDVADPTDSYDAVNLRSLTLVMDSAQAIIQQMQLQLSQSQQQWQIQQQQIQQQWQETQQQWQIQQMQLQQQIDSLTLILNAMAADTAFTQWNTSVVNETACNTYEWHNQTYTQSGVYLYGFTNTDGSNNVEALNLTIVHSDTTHLQEEACESYTWHDATYSESGEYTHLLTNSLGCDSVLVLHLTIHNGTHNEEAITTLDSYTWHDTTYAESGVYTYSYDNEHGCMSTDTLKLTINRGSHTACESFVWHDSNYTESGVYNYSHTDEGGFAVVDTLILTILYGTHNVETRSACGSYEWHDSTYTQSGNYTYVYNNEYGCTSVDTLKVRVVPVDEKSCPLAPCATDIDGNIYATVQIGDQCWMRENMRCTTSPSTGTPILASPSGTSYTGKKAYYVNGDAANTLFYGLLYNWNAAVDTFNTVFGETSANSSSSNAVSVAFSGQRRGICPQGWHIPSDAEWTQLTDYVNSQEQYRCNGTSGYIAKALASETGWSVNSGLCSVGNSSTNNLTGFTAVPAGFYEGGFTHFGTGLNIWSATQNSYRVWRRYMFTQNNSTGVTRAYDFGKNYGCSVRCLRDTGATNSQVQLPMVITRNASNVTRFSATLNGTVTADGGAAVTARGVCWSTNPSPTTDGLHTNDGSGTGTFTSSMTGLTPNTTYYVRAYATNSVGTAYGTEVMLTTAATTAFLCGDKVRDHQNNEYNTVQIGEQCWMKENMRCTTSPTTGTTFLETAPNGTSYTGKKAYYVNGNPDNTLFYGLLYNWNAAVDTFNTAYEETSTNSSSSNAVSVTFGSQRRGICPQGWHVPSDAEWTILSDYVNSQIQYVCGTDGANIAKALAAETGWSVNSSSCSVGNSPTNNRTGFTAVPAGFYNGSFNHFGIGMDIMSVTQVESGSRIGVWYRYLFTQNNPTGMTRSNDHYKNQGLSVRCLRDTGTVSNGGGSGTGGGGGGEENECIGTHNVETGSACEFYTWHGTTYYESGVYTYGYVNADTCPSVDTLFLTIYEPATTEFSATACDFYAWNGTEYTQSGDYTRTFTTAHGCDSVVTLHLTIHRGTHIVYYETAYDSYTWHGQTYTESGTYTHPYTNAHGCASTETLILTIRNGAPEEERVVACGSYTWHGNTYTASGTYTYSYTTSDGNSHEATLFLTIYEPTTTEFSATACESYVWNGTEYTQSGDYTQTFTTAHGCDSVVTLHLTVHNGTHNNVTAEDCESYTWHGQTYTQTNTYTYSYNNDDNCPSVDTLFLTIYQPTTTEFSATACESYVWNGIEYTQSGDYTQTFTTAHGCDSVVTLHLTVHKGTHNNVTAEDCESYTWHGQTYTQTNTYTYSYNNDDNCPSVDTLFLTIYESAATAFSVTVCESYVWNGIECTQNGDYTQTFTTAHGCDSVVTLHLTISNEIPNVSTDTVCDSFSWHDSTFIESGTYTYIDTTSSLCPIVDTLHLTIYKSTYNGFTDTAEGPYTWHGQTYFESGTYLHIDTNANGCPSVDTLNLTIITTDTIYSNTGCPGMPIVMDHEGNVYNTVKIGGQCWTRENMRCVTSPLTGDTLLTEWSAYTGKAANWNPYNVTRDPAYGLLYNWCAALDTFDVAHNYPEIASIRDTSFFPCTFSGPHRGICPEGWHVPDTTEWGRMLKYVHDSGYQCPDCSRYGWLFDGDVECIAKALSSTTGWDIDHYTSCSVGNDLPANNATGFSALPGGHCYLDIYRSFGEGAFFWSATMDTKFWNEVLEDTSLVSTPYHYVIYNDDSYVEKSICSLNDENSVRCVRDYDNCGTHHDLQISSCDSYTWHGQTYTESGTYYYGYTNELGCPCTERLYLTINDGTHNVVTAGDCQYYVWHGHTYDTSGTYTYEYVNEHGCPSVDTLKLTIQPHVYLTFYEEAENEYHWHGQTYYASGTYVYEDTNDHGCPYTDTLHLTFINGEPCTGTPVVIDVDGNIYHTVQIGNQCWMKENLRVTRRTDSTSIPYESNPDVTVSLQGDEQQYLTAPYWCYPDNNPANKNTYGLLYNWPAASGICPTGWHLPSRAEWQQLISYVSSQTEYVCGNDNDNIAKALAAQTGWPESSVACAVGNTPSTNNTTGFSAYPAGSYGNNYLSYGNLAVFWSTTQYYSEYFAYCCHLTFNEASADGGSFNIKSNAVSVRCLRD
ncbi:MAG: fibrobacter succinogenes major paralogous domain-containing protein [Bacteroidales bacterium]|nr:fibrobacter succinogenes major paralogous domain-containing protein [Bacteroidales bacterium]